MKKFPAEDVRMLVDEKYIDDHYLDYPEEWPETFGDLKVIDVGEWIGGAGTNNRSSILQEVSTEKYYRFDEEEDTGPGFTINIWENYPDMKEVGLHEVKRKEEIITKVTWERIK